jgi:hypothetical protein
MLLLLPGRWREASPTKFVILTHRGRCDARAPKLRVTAACSDLFATRCLPGHMMLVPWWDCPLASKTAVLSSVRAPSNQKLPVGSCLPAYWMIIRATADAVNSPHSLAGNDITMTSINAMPRPPLWPSQDGTRSQWRSTCLSGIQHNACRGRNAQGTDGWRLSGEEPQVSVSESVYFAVQSSVLTTRGRSARLSLGGLDGNRRCGRGWPTGPVNSGVQKPR